MNNFADFLTIMVPAVLSALVAILTAIITARLTFQGYLHQTKAELEKEYSSRFNTNKWEVYTKFTALVRDIVKPSLDPPMAGLDILGIPQDQYLGIASQIVLIGSDQVVNAFRTWRETGLAYGQAHMATKEKLFKLIAEMRRDLGNKHTRLNMDDLFGSLELGS